MKNILLFPHVATAKEVSPDEGRAQSALYCATFVLQHSEGHLGFLGGDALFKALIRDALVIELATSPRHFALSKSEVSYRTLHAEFGRQVTCTAPSSVLLRELEVVARNHIEAKTNVIRARHGRPLVHPVPTSCRSGNRVSDQW